MKKFLTWCVVLAVAWIAFKQAQPLIRGLGLAEGVLVKDIPQQYHRQFPNPPSWVVGEWTVKPICGYRLNARVLDTTTYSGDKMSDLAPIDLAVAWGMMSDSAVLAKFRWEHGDREIRLFSKGELPASADDLCNCVSNIHAIPADENVRHMLLSFGRNSLIKLDGYLVEVSSKTKNAATRSSVWRNDRGNGACEIMYVTSAGPMDQN